MKRSRQTAFPFVSELAHFEKGRKRPAQAARRLSMAIAPSEPDPEALKKTLEADLASQMPGARVLLKLTDNSHTMISVRREKGFFQLRLHHMFLNADPVTVRALGRYVSHNDRQASRLLGRFIEINQEKIRRAQARAERALVLQTRGQFFDLQNIFDDLNRRYFHNAIDARITWGQPQQKRRRHHRSIKMGSYSVEERLVRIHRSLDRAFVPRPFLAWIVFHEMLHQKHSIPTVSGRRRYHTPAFLAEEATFEHYPDVSRWERENLDRLLHF